MTDPAPNNIISNIFDTLANHYGLLRFFTGAVIIFSLLMFVYKYILLDSTMFNAYLEFCAKLANAIINAISDSQTHVFTTRSGMLPHIKSDKYSVYVTVARGCDASTVFSVLICTIGAWPSPFIKKITAIAVGLTIMFSLNILRITGMMFVEMHIPDYYDLFHVWLLPNLLIVGALIYFFIWTRISGLHPDDNFTAKEL